MPALIDSFKGPYAFLSNFYPVEIEWEGLVYPSLEHAFQASKTTSEDLRRYVRDQKTPGLAKRAGRTLELREDWDSERLWVMEALLVLKFSRPDLAEKLLATGDARLVEGNDWGDRFWGAVNGAGHNHLGKLLEKVRAAMLSSAQKDGSHS